MYLKPIRGRDIFGVCTYITAVDEKTSQVAGLVTDINVRIFARMAKTSNRHA